MRQSKWFFRTVSVLSGVVMLILSGFLTDSAFGIISNDIRPAARVRANGEYVISVWSQDGWQKAGSLVFDSHVTSREIELVTRPPRSGRVQIRLTQVGGGAAHIDSVFLGGHPPLEVKGSDDPMAMRKIAKKDFDVIDAGNKDIELVFEASKNEDVLILSARVEPEVISKTPFQFPIANLFKPVQTNSQFYAYMLRVPGRKNADTPVFTEYSVTGSGHPSGYTYGLVGNDEKNLYVTLDFTPDNTLDGEKDYAKVHVRTETGLKEFKVSVPETRWGAPNFTYTDKVAYQHKVYDFIIPLDEIGLAGPEEGRELQLAFSAYGTATPEEYQHEILIDSNPSSGGGVLVEDANGQVTIPGIDYRVQVSVATVPMPKVLGGSVLKWNPSTSSFETAAWLTQQYPLGIGQGIGGTNSVEWGVDLSALDHLAGTFTGYFHSSKSGPIVPNDYSAPFSYTIPRQTTVPTISEWGMYFWAAAILLLSIRFLGKKSKNHFFIVMVLVCLISGIAWAVMIQLDGNMTDWASVNPIVTDVMGDQSGDFNEDIRYGFVTDDGSRIYFRIDYSGED